MFQSFNVCGPQKDGPQIYRPQIFGPQIYRPQIYGPQIYGPQIYTPQIYGHKYMDHKYMGHQYTGSKYFGLEVKEQVGRVGSCDVGNYLPICPLATSSVKIKRRSTFILRPPPFGVPAITGFVQLQS